MYVLTKKGIFFTRTSSFTKSNFLLLANIKPNSWIATVVERQYEQYFENAVLLSTEYKKFYLKEFNSFNIYLSQRYNLFSEEISLFDTTKIYYRNVTSYIMGQLMTKDNDSNVFYPLI
ncbi:MAG: hypothetical protein LBJ14_07705, partial [Desulfarculales bacterium]|nr:hypothetical protein [Desulfarculales bacterium]